MSKFTVTCLPLGGGEFGGTDSLCAVWLECDDDKVQEYGNKICREIFNGEESFQILSGHLSQEEVKVGDPGESTLEQIMEYSDDSDPKEEWYLDRGFIMAFGSF